MECFLLNFDYFIIYYIILNLSCKLIDLDPLLLRRRLKVLLKASPLNRNKSKYPPLINTSNKRLVPLCSSNINEVNHHL